MCPHSYPEFHWGTWPWTCRGRGAESLLTEPRPGHRVLCGDCGYTSPGHSAIGRHSNYSLVTVKYVSGWPKSAFGFSCKMVLVVCNFIRNSFVILYCDSCHISLRLKKLIKIGECLCSHFNIEDGRKYATFLAYHALLFQDR